MGTSSSHLQSVFPLGIHNIRRGQMGISARPGGSPGAQDGLEDGTFRHSNKQQTKHSLSLTRGQRGLGSFFFSPYNFQRHGFSGRDLTSSHQPKPRLDFFYLHFGTEDKTALPRQEVAVYASLSSCPSV